MNLTYILTSLFWVFIFSIYGYNLFLVLVGIKKPKKTRDTRPSKKFVCIIPAHNEENVIGALVDSLRSQNYPKRFYQVFVIADCCNDNTAKIARRKGAIVLEKNQVGGGKGAALRFFLAKLFDGLHGERFDAVCFFDADNTVHPDFLQKMNNALCQGKKCVQGYLGTKNPRDNWVTTAIYASYLVTNRHWQLNKGSLSLSAGCGGTGFCITTDLLKKYGWPAQSLTEDLEMEIFYALKGIQFFWAHDAIVYDEKPRSLKVALRQRTRWLIGHLNILRKYFVKLLVGSIKAKDIRLFDQAFYLLSPIYWFAIGFLTFMWGLELIIPIGIFYLGTAEAIALNLLMLLVYPGTGIWLETRSLKDLKMIPPMLLFAPIWVLALILAIKNFSEKEWFHTPHGQRDQVN